MDWQKKINQTIDYIESNLEDEMDINKVAQYARCSTWELQRVFSLLAHIPLGEYIRFRKLTLAAKDIQASNEKIIDIAIKYGYDSPAAFSRAFSRFHGKSPLSARNDGVTLNGLSRITLKFYDKRKLENMQKYSERNYYVKENAPIYFARDMEVTFKWFRDVLGWYGDVCARNDCGVPEYGCVFDYPSELMVSNLTPFKGIHMFTGEPVKGVVAFINVQGLDALYKHVKESGWDLITEIAPQHWGARECQVTTPDGSIIRFFETTE